MLRRLFPALTQRGALTMNAEYCESYYYSESVPRGIVFGLTSYPAGHVGHDGDVRTPIIISADSRWAATGSEDGTIIIWDLESGCIAQEWFAEDTGVDSLAFSPDSRYIVSTGSREAAIIGEWATVWDLHQGARRVRSLRGEGEVFAVSLFPPCRNCAWPADGSWIAAGGQAGGAVHMWETTTFQRVQCTSTWKGSELLAFSADGRWVATAAIGARPHTDLTRSTTAWIWGVDSKSGSSQLHRSLQGHADRVCAAAFNPRSTRVATGSLDSTIRIWDVQTGEQLLILQERARRRIDAVVFSGDGGMVLPHSSAASHRLDAQNSDGPSSGVKVWDAVNGILLASLPGMRVRELSAPRSGSASCACFSPCGSYVASVSDDEGVLLWRTGDWSCVAEVSGGGAPVTRVAISPDGRVLCCGTEVGTVFFRLMHDLVSANETG